MKAYPVKATISIVGIILFFSGCARKEKRAEEEKIKLFYADIAWAKYDDLRRAQLREFEKVRPGVECEYIPLPIQYITQKLSAMYEGGCSPDVHVVRMDLADAVMRGYLLDLTPYIEKNWDYFKEFNPKALRRDYGSYYVVPSNLGTKVLFYNKRLFDEAGVEYPDEAWDWNDFREAAIKLTKRDGEGNVTQWGASIMALWWQFAVQNGAKIWDENETKCAFDSPEAAEAFRFYKELFAKYKVTRPPEPANAERFRRDFRGGQSAMFIGGRWRLIEFNEGDSPVRDDWRVAPLPKAYNGSRKWEYSSNILGVSAQSKHPDMAFELLKFLTRPEYTKHLIREGDSIPLRTSGEEMEIFLHDNERPHEDKQAYLLMLNDKDSYSRRDLFSDFIPMDRQIQALKYGYERYMMPGSELTAEETVHYIAREMDYLYRRYQAFKKFHRKRTTGGEEN